MKIRCHNDCHANCVAKGIYDEILILSRKLTHLTIKSIIVTNYITFSDIDNVTVNKLLLSFNINCRHLKYNLCDKLKSITKLLIFSDKKDCHFYTFFAI